jgi:hypothetical protein
MVLALLAVLTPLALSVADEAPGMPLDIPPDIRGEIAAGIRLRGYTCPEVKAYTVGQDARGANLRIVCGRVGGSPDPALTFLLTKAGPARWKLPWLPF